MSVAQLERNLDITQDTPVTKDSKMGAQLRRAIERMTEHCESQHNQAKFIAKGLVVDTLGDVRQQVIDYFPKHINVQPVLDDIAREVGIAAKESGQQYQEVSFLYVNDANPLPQQSGAGRQFAVKIYGQDGAAEGLGYGGMSHTLKPAGSGSSGSGMDLLQYLNCAIKKVFALVISAVDADDIRILEQHISPDVVQAFGGTPDAMHAMQAILAVGGSVAAVAEGVLSVINTSTNLQQALQDAPTPAQAQNVTAALAHQADSLSASLPSIAEQLPAPVVREITRQLDAIKTEVSAQKAAQIITEVVQPTVSVSASISPIVVAPMQSTPVNDVVKPVVAANSPIASAEPQTVQAAQRIADIAAAQSLSVAEVIVLSKVDTAPVSLKQSVHSALEQIAQTPALSEKMATPITVEPQAVVQQLQKLAEQAPILTQAAQVLETAIAPVANTTAPNIAQPMQVQSVAENLQAMQKSQHISPDVKAQLAVIAPQVEVIAIQMRSGIIEPAPIVQQVISPVVPINAIPVAANTVVEPVVAMPAAPQQQVQTVSPLQQAYAVSAQGFAPPVIQAVAPTEPAVTNATISGAVHHVALATISSTPAQSFDSSPVRKVETYSAPVAQTVEPQRYEAPLVKSASIPDVTVQSASAPAVNTGYAAQQTAQYDVSVPAAPVTPVAAVSSSVTTTSSAAPVAAAPYIAQKTLVDNTSASVFPAKVTPIQNSTYATQQVDVVGTAAQAPTKVVEANIYSFPATRAANDSIGQAIQSPPKGVDSFVTLKTEVKVDVRPNVEKSRTPSFADTIDKIPHIGGDHSDRVPTLKIQGTKTPEKASKCAGCFKAACEGRGSGVCPVAMLVVNNMGGPRVH